MVQTFRSRQQRSLFDVLADVGALELGEKLDAVLA